MPKPKPKTKTLNLKVDPFQGAARLATSIVPPDGYRFRCMDRKGENVKITFELIN